MNGRARPSERRQFGFAALPSFDLRTMNHIVMPNDRIELGEHIESRRLDHSTLDLVSSEFTNGGERFPHRYYNELDSTRLVFSEQNRFAISFDCFQRGEHALNSVARIGFRVRDRSPASPNANDHR